MYEPNFEMNKVRDILQLVDNDEEDEEEDGGDVGMDMLKNLGKMMGMPDMDNMMKGEGEESAAAPKEEETSAPEETSAAPEEETSASSEDH